MNGSMSQRVSVSLISLVSVFECKEITGAGLLGTVDRDFADNKLIASEIYLSPFTGDSLVFRTAQYQFFDLTRAFFLEWIRYDFNRRTHKVKILGRDPHRDVFFNTYVKIPLDKLYEDYYFTRYVTAKSKIALGTMLGFFDYNFKDPMVIHSILSSAILGMVGTSMASILFYYLVKQAGILFGSMVTYGIPIVAVVWGLIYGESLAPLQVVCLGIILLGVYIVNRGNLNFIPFLKQKSPQS